MPVDTQLNSIDRSGNRKEFVRNWVSGASDNRSLRRRLMAILRLAHMALGMGRKRLGLGSLGVGGSIAATLEALGIGNPAAMAQSLAANADGPICPGCGRLIALPAAGQRQIAERRAQFGLANGKGALAALIFGALAAGTVAPGDVWAMSVSIDGNECLSAANATMYRKNPGATNGPGMTAGGVQSGSGSGTYGWVSGCASVGNGLGYTSIGSFATATGTGVTAVGNSAVATGRFATAVGVEAAATGEGSSAYGVGSIASGSNTIAIGGGGASVLSEADSTRATADGAIAIGVNGLRGAQATSINSIAIGGESSAGGEGASALGLSSTAAADYSTAIGHQSNAQGMGSAALGSGASTGAEGATAVGNNASAQGISSFAGGRNALAQGENSIAIGGDETAGASATGIASIAMGSNASAATDGAVAIGQSSLANAENSISIGTDSVANSADAIAIGTGANAAGGKAISIGAGNVANGDGAVAIGDPNAATGTGAVAQGSDNTATGNGTIAIGSTNLAGAGDQAVGVPGTPADGAVALGQNNNAFGQGAVAIGNGNVTSGQGAIALGNTSQATWEGAVALGDAAQATEYHAIGIGANAVASGQAATAVGQDAVSSGIGSSAFGSFAQATGNGAVAFGGGTLSSGNNSVAIGAGSVSEGAHGVAIGSDSNSGAFDGAVAIGENAVTNNDNDVAIGSGSVTAATVGTTDVTINGTTYTFAGTTPASTVSVGSVGAERTITNVAAGQVTGTSTDAVNGSQLFATNQAVDEIGTQVGEVSDRAVKYDGNIGDPKDTITLEGTAGTTITNVAPGELSATSTEAVNGSQLFATNQQVDQNTTDITNLGDTITNIAGDTSTTYVEANGTGIRYVRTNETGLTPGDSSAQGQGSTAVGYEATAAGANALALGNGAQATEDGSIALGAGSATAAAVGTAGTTIDGTTYTFAGAIPTSTVSVGAVGAERTITNVAAGQVTATSTDAVNGSQLFATNQAIENLSTNVEASATHYYSVNDGGTVRANYNNDGATGVDSIAAGVNASSTGTSSIAIGTNALASGSSAVNAGVAIGYDTVAGERSVAIGSRAGIGSSAIEATFIGQEAGQNASGTWISFVGQEAGRNSAGDHNTGMGQNAMRFSQGGNNTAFGSNALAGAWNGSTADPTDFLTVVGQGNTAIGSGSGSLVNGDDNTFTGRQSGYAAQGTGNVASGITAGANVSGDSNVATGNRAGRSVTGNDNVAMGHLAGSDFIGTIDPITGAPSGGYNNLQVNGTVAVGSQSLASADDAIAIGTNSNASGVESIAIGANAIATGSVAMGSAARAGNGGAAFGDGAIATYLGGTLTPGTVAGTAIGQNASADITGGTAIGTGSVASNENDVALGAGSVTAIAVGTSGITIDGTAYTFAGATPTSTMSVGAVGSERTITNVAAGQVATTSTDAINGSQLFATNQAIENLGSTVEASATHYYSVNDGGTVGGNYNNDGATGTNSLAAGVGASATAVGGTAVGYGSVASGGGFATAIGYQNTASDTGAVAVGLRNQASANLATAVGSNNTVSGDGGSAAFGNGNSISGQASVALGNWNDVSSLNASAIGLLNTVSAQNGFAAGVGNTSSAPGGVAVGVSNTSSGNISFAAGTASVASAEFALVVGYSSEAAGVRSIALGAGVIAGSDQSVAIGTGAQAMASAGDVALGAGSITATVTGTSDATINGTTYTFAGTTPASTVSVGNVGTERTITNVAAGRIGATSTDAINGSQLFATNQAVEAIDDDVAELGDRAVKYDGALGDPKDTITLEGTAGTTITNLADGEISATSTDAVNGSQLFATNQQVDQNTTDITNLGDTLTNIAGDTSTTYTEANGVGIRYARTNETGLAQTDAFAQGVGSTAVGYQATASAESALALGRDAQADVLGGVALGAGSIANRAIAPSSGTIPAGSAVITYNTTDQELLGAVSVGRDGAYRQITNVADGTDAQDAVTIRQLQGAIASVGVTATQYFHANSAAPDSLAIGTDSIAVGPSTVVNGDNGIGMGNGSIVDATAPGGTAIGQDAHVMMADGIALGTSSQAGGEQAVAIGAGAVADHYLGVALGSGSMTAAAVGTSEIVINGQTYAFAGASPESVVSIGAVGAERQLINVAAGRVTADSTDAINGSQLFATNQAVEAIDSEVGEVSDRAVKYDGNIGDPKDTITLEGTTGTRITNLTAGAVNATSTDAINGSQLYDVSNSIANHLGGGATVNPDGTVNGPTYVMQGGNYTTVYDTFAAVDTSLTNINNTITDINNGGGIKYFHANSAAADSQAIGQESVAVGPTAVANADNSVAMGNGATTVAGADGAVALGQGATASNAGDVALGSGSTTQAVVNTSGTTINGTDYAFAGTNATSTVSVGGVGSERTITNVAAGRVTADSTDAINGSQLYATNEAIDDLASGIGDLQDGAVMYDKNPDGTRGNSVTLIGGDPSAPVLISNVADGVANNDAVNVGQLKEGLSNTLIDANSYTDNRVSYAIDTANSYTDQVAVTTLNQANSYTDSKFNQLNSEIGEVRNEARQAAAIGLAAASLRYDDRPGKASVAIGGGVWRGQGAFAMGAGYTSEDGRVRANLSATTAGGKWGAGAGLSFTFN